MEITPSNTPEKKTTWLQRLKDESWEAELLVSAVAIYAIFNTFSLFDWICNMFIDKLDPSQYLIGYMITFLGFLAFGILGALFVIHFGLRAYWIGLVGLNSVFPDYSLEDSAYSKTFTEKMLAKLPRLQNSITNLDEICSVIFSVAFTLLLIYSYLGLVSSIYLLLFNLLSDYIPNYVLLIPLVIFAAIYIAQMILTIVANIKKFKTNDTVQTWYFQATILGSALLYGPLYKNLLQITMIFGSNFKKKKALVRTMIFMLAFGAILGTYKLFDSNVLYLMGLNKDLDTTKAYEFYYSTNNSENKFLLTPEIQTDLVESKAIQLFIPIFDNEISKLEEICELNPNGDFKKPSTAERNKIRESYLNCYTEMHQIALNENPIEVQFLKTDHPITDQFGIKTFIDLSALQSGNHTITVFKKLGEKKEKSWEIPFYYAPN
jgi:hypothetical protein